MKRFLLILQSVYALISCTDTYTINGTTSLTHLEGDMLYLKVFDGQRFTAIDSCSVLHGVFSFNGKRDSVEMGLIFFDERNLMPVMLDGTSVVVDVTETQKQAFGTAMNDSLYKFIAKKAEIDDEIDSLSASLGQRVMNGEDLDDVMMDLSQKSAILDEQLKNSLMHFIKTNYSNAMGVGMFMLVTMDNPYPLLTPRIEEIYTGAGAYFLGSSYVKRFFNIAESNMLLMREGKELERM